MEFTNKIFLFLDLDDTIIQTKRKTNFDREVNIASFTQDKQVSSYIYKGLNNFLDVLLDNNIILVPVTARSLSSYQRTIFSKDPRINLVVLNFSGIILINNNIDLYWEEKIKQDYKSIKDINTLYEDLLNFVKLNFDKELKIVNVDNFYINIHNKQYSYDNFVNAEIKELLKRYLLDKDNFYLYQNENVFGILPKFLNKSKAVSYIKNKYQPIFSIAGGDNISDLDFMNLADFKLIPQNSSIDKIFKLKNFTP